MPVETKGFWNKHFEKIACGAVGVGLALSLLYVSRRVSGGKVEKLLDRIDAVTGKLETDMRKPPPPAKVPQYVAVWEEAYRLVEPGDTPERFWYHWPVYYNTVYMGPDKDFVLKFKEPLSPKSVHLEREDPPGSVITRIEHPVGMDYTQVRVHTGTAGTVRVVGLSGQTPHVQPVVVDPRAGTRAEPPLALKVTPRLGYIEVRWEPNPANRDTVIVQAYEVYRKSARDVGAEYEKVQQVRVLECELSEESKRILKQIASAKKPAGEAKKPTAPGRAAPAGATELWLHMPGLAGGAGAPPGVVPAAAETRPQEETKCLYLWRDTEGIVPGKTFLYKVRTIAYMSFPRESHFQVAIYDGKTVRRREFSNAIGEEIGGVVQEPATGALQNFLTGCYLLDCHRAVRQPGGGSFRHRIIFVNPHGEVEQRWLNETVAPDLWKKPTVEMPTGQPRPGMPPRPGYLPPRPGYPGGELMHPLRRRP